MTDDTRRPSGSGSQGDPGSERSKRKPPPSRTGTVLDLNEVRTELTETEKRRQRQRRRGGRSGDGPDGGDTPPAAAPKALRAATDLKLVLQEAGFELSRDRSGRAVVTLTSDPNRPNLYVDSDMFKGELRLIYAARRQDLHQHGKIGHVISKAAIDDVCSELAAQARHAPRYDYRLRACDWHGERWIDLCLAPDDWRMLRITRDGWSVQRRYTADRPRNTDIRLIRHPDMLPLAIPDASKKQEAMRLYRARLAGVSEDGFKLVMCVKQAVWRAGVPAPLLVLTGPYGAWKTMILRMIGMICDPSVGGVRGMPTDPDAVEPVLASARFTGFDNKTGLTQEMSDLLCQNATGVTVGGRQFYRQRDHVNIALQSVVGLTVLSSPIERPDLGSRAVDVPVRKTGAEYIPEEDLAKDDVVICSGMVAALADAAVAELRNKGRHFPGLGRMADFERGSRAAAEAFGWSDAEMAALFRRHQQSVQNMIIEGDPLIGALTGYLREQAGDTDGMAMVSMVRRKMTARQWWLAILERWPQYRSRDSGFPQSEGLFGRQLNERTDALLAKGISLRRITVKGTALIELSTTIDQRWEAPTGASATPPAAPEPPAERCPGCGGSGWWWADQTGGEWCCRGCEPIPTGATNLQEWPQPPRN